MSAEFAQHLERSILWACRLEVLAPKPGNVHPRAAFVDLDCRDFLRSAELVAPILAGYGEKGVGQSILEAVTATRSKISSNTNLGIVLLIAPAASVSCGIPLREGIGDRLRGLSFQDAVDVYEAIRRAEPGGMGKVPDQDVRTGPTVTLLEAMGLAADRDTIAAQYKTDYRLVFEGVDFLQGSRFEFSEHWKDEIVRLSLWLQSRVPDSLIARKCGPNVAREASCRASEVLDAWEDPGMRRTRLADFDAWLRGDGHRRNPGTTADLVAAVLFAAFRDRILPMPDTWAVPPCLEFAP
jgi:triphosphoribosyl-dephospho-CoA synthase